MEIHALVIEVSKTNPHLRFWTRHYPDYHLNGHRGGNLRHTENGYNNSQCPFQGKLSEIGTEPHTGRMPTMSIGGLIRAVNIDMNVNLMTRKIEICGDMFLGCKDVSTE